MPQPAKVKLAKNLHCTIHKILFEKLRFIFDLLLREFKNLSKPFGENPSTAKFYVG